MENLLSLFSQIKLCFTLTRSILILMKNIFVRHFMDYILTADYYTVCYLGIIGVDFTTRPKLHWGLSQFIKA